MQRAGSLGCGVLATNGVKSHSSGSSERPNKSVILEACADELAQLETFGYALFGNRRRVYRAIYTKHG